jgi:hypothetical protein
MKCPDCPMKYPGQTGCISATRFKQNFKAFKNNSRKLIFTEHVINKKHYFDKTESVISIISVVNKDNHMNTIEKFHISMAKR